MVRKKKPTPTLSGPGTKLVSHRGKPERSFSRRGFLRGAAGTVIGLPLLECMLNTNGTAYADGSDLPCRYFLFHAPSSLLGSGSGRDADDLATPTRAGFGYDRKRVLEPLGERGIAEDVSAISGLFAAPVDAPGGYDSDYHGLGLFAVLGGQRAGWDQPSGTSSDQLVSDALGGTTLFSNIFYQLDPVTGRSHRVSFRYDPDSYRTRRTYEPEISPAQAYRALFASFVPPDREPDPEAVLAQRLRVSSLSLAGEEINALNARLGVADRRILDEHLTNIRALERRIAGVDLTPPAPSCVDPEHSTSDPENLAGGVPDQEARARLFAELSQVAFTCDMTRVITIGGTSVMTGTGMLHDLWRDRGGLHAEVQHSSPHDRVAQANRWFVDIYADVIQRLKNTPEGDGNVLDRTAGVFIMEGGKSPERDPMRAGDGGGDPNHSCDNMLLLLAGQAGGLRPGQHVNLSGRDLHPCVVLNTAMEAVGVPAGLGEITDTVPALFEG